MKKKQNKKVEVEELVLPPVEQNTTTKALIQLFNKEDKELKVFEKAKAACRISKLNIQPKGEYAVDSVERELAIQDMIDSLDEE